MKAEDVISEQRPKKKVRREGEGASDDDDEGQDCVITGERKRKRKEGSSDKIKQKSQKRLKQGVKSGSYDLDLIKPPKPLTCPITLQPFEDPVFLTYDGFTYEGYYLAEWMDDPDHQHTPMGIKLPKDVLEDGDDPFYYKGKQTRVVNRALRSKPPYLCPFTREEFVDPMLVLENGGTYEHWALLRHLQETLCKGKTWNGMTEVTAYCNKVLWKADDSDQRKKFVMPRPKEYKGFDMRPLMDAESETLIGNAYDLFEIRGYHDEKRELGVCNGVHRYRVLRNCIFRNGCFKVMVFKNCRFDRCIFDRTCMCSKFKNCMFQDCVFLSVTSNTENSFLCPGSSFKRCRVDKKSSAFCVNEIGGDDKLLRMIQGLSFKRAKEVDLCML